MKHEIKAIETQIEVSTIVKSAWKTTNMVRNFNVVEVLFTFKLRRFCGDNHFNASRLAKSCSTILCNTLATTHVQQYVCAQSLKAVGARTCAQLKGSSGYHFPETLPNQRRSQGGAARASAPQDLLCPPK